MLTVRINGLYMHDHGKIILFNSKEEIDYFINQFISYSINKEMLNGFGGFSGINIGEIMALRDNIIVEEWTDKLANSCTCGTAKYNDIINKKR